MRVGGMAERAGGTIDKAKARWRCGCHRAKSGGKGVTKRAEARYGAS